MSKPTVKELKTQLDDLVRNWEIFGLQLPGIKESILEKIKYNKRYDDVDSQKATLYGKWLEVYPKASWDDVTKALIVVGENRMAKDLQEWLSSSDKQMPSSPEQLPQTQVTPASTDPSTTTECEVPESIVDELEDLHETFVPLATIVNNKLEEAVDDGKVSVKSLARYVQLQSVGHSRAPPTSGMNAEQILQSVQDQYTFLSPNIILNMATFFLAFHPIAGKAKEYKTRITTFKKKVTVISLKNKLGRFNQQFRNSPSNSTRLKIVVTNAWSKQSIFLVEILLLTLFPIVDPDDLKWYSVCAGSFLLSFIASNHMILPLIVSCARKMEFMRHLGIISITIGNILIRVDNEVFLAADDDSFSFKDSLVQATVSDNIEAVRFMLKYMYTHVNVNATHTKYLFLQRFYHEQLRYQTEDKTLEVLHLLVHHFKIIGEDILEQITSTEDRSSGRPDIKLLQEMEHHALNTTLLKNQLSHLPDPFQQKLTNLYKRMDAEKGSAKIEHLEKFLQSAPAHDYYTTQVAITLSKVWRECSVQGIQVMITFLFPDTIMHGFYWFRVKKLKKALKIELSTTGQFSFNDLPAKALGVIKVQVDNDTIFTSEENKDGYTFMKGIREAKRLDIIHQLSLVPFLQRVMEFPCQLIHGDTIEPDHNNNFQMVPDYDSTPLMIACCNGNGQLVQLLLEHGADPNTKTNAFKTALFCCANSSTIFQMLLNYGANIAVKNKLNETPLQNACLTNTVKVVDMLLNNKYPHINTKNKRGYTPLFRACSRGYTDIVERLLKAKADPSIPNDVGATPLWAASAGGHLSIVEILLKDKVDPNTLDAEGRTPLWVASCEGHEAVVKHLLQAKADPDIPDNRGRTPLQIACRNAHVRTTSILFNHMLANCKTDEDRSVWIATAERQLTADIVHLLLLAQEDPSALGSM